MQFMFKVTFKIAYTTNYHMHTNADKLSQCVCVDVWIFEWLFINSRVSTSNWACHFCIAAASSGFVINVCLPWLMDHLHQLRLKLTFSYELV